jgi:hypothetical protein
VDTVTAQAGDIACAGMAFIWQAAFSMAAGFLQQQQGSNFSTACVSTRAMTGATAEAQWALDPAGFGQSMVRRTDADILPIDCVISSTATTNHIKVLPRLFIFLGHYRMPT